MLASEFMSVIISWTLLPFDVDKYRLNLGTLPFGKRFFLCEGVADEGVVVASGVERGIGAYQVDACVVEFAQDFKVITEVEFVHGYWFSSGAHD